MATKGVLAAIFGPIISGEADAATNALIANQQTIVAELTTVEGSVATWVEDELLAAIPTQSLEEKIAHGEITGTIKNLATEIEAQLPAGNAAVLNALESGLESLSASLSAPG